MKRRVGKFNANINLDVASAEKIQETNNKLHRYLLNKGEVDAAEQLKFILNNEKDEELDTPKTNQSTSKLLVVNTKILSVLEKIQRDMIDEQDTSIKPIASMQNNGGGQVTNTSNLVTSESVVDVDDESTFDLDIPRHRVQKTPKGGAGSRGKKIPKGPDKKILKKASKLSSSKNIGKKTVKLAGKLAGKVALGALKFAGPIGAIITAGMAAYDGVDGWNEASKTFDLDEGIEASIGQKSASALGSVVSGLTLGMADAKKTSKGINNLFGGNPLINKYEKEGILSHHTIGDSAIRDWTSLTRLPSNEIQKIIDLDDWNKDDLDRLKNIKKENERIENNIEISKEANGQVKPKDDTKNIENPIQANPISPQKVNENDVKLDNAQPSVVDPIGNVNHQKSITNPGKSIPKISDDEDIKDLIKQHEGVRYRPYKDSLGLWTVGRGHLIGDGKTLPEHMDREFSEEEVDELFEEDYAAHKLAAEKIPGFNDLNKTGQGALTDLTFNMGGKWYKRWPKFTKSISKGNTFEAAKSLEDSKWYDQVGNRAPKIVSMVKAGRDNDDVSSNKNTESKVVKYKASDINSTDNEVQSGEIKPEIFAETHKDNREALVNKTSYDLRSEVVAQNTIKNSKQSETVIPVISANINNINQHNTNNDERLLNLFS